MDRHDTLLRLIHGVYASPGSLEKWHVFLTDVCHVLHGSGASFMAHNMSKPASQVVVTTGIDAEPLRQYTTYWGLRDPWANSPGTRKLTSGEVVPGDALLPHSQMVRTAFYNDFARAVDTTRCLAGMIDVDRHGIACVSINRGDRGEPFGTNDVALLQALMPHLQRGLQLHRQLADAEVQLAARSDALDRVSHGVLVMSARGRLVFANRAGEALLRSRDGLAFEDNELRGSRPQDTAALGRALRDAIKTSEGEGLESGGVVTLGRPSGKRPLVVVISPVAARTLLLAADPPAAVVIVTDPDRAVMADERVIRQVWNLTPAEARLARVLAEGLDLDQAAAALGLTIETVRTRLKVIFNKTQTRRQAELVRLVLTSTAGVQL